MTHSSLGIIGLPHEVQTGSSSCSDISNYNEVIIYKHESCGLDSKLRYYEVYIMQAARHTKDLITGCLLYGFENIQGYDDIKDIQQQQKVMP